MFTCYLFIDESIHIEVYSFQVQNQILRGLAYPCFLGDNSFFIAEITLEIINQLS